MVMLSTEDRNELIDHLKGKTFLLRRETLEGIFRRAGLREQLPMINLSGTPTSMLDNIISFLEDYGKVSSEQEALGLFLNAMKENVGWDEKDFIDKLVTKYNLIPTSEMSAKQKSATVPVSYDGLGALTTNLRIANRLAYQQNYIAGRSPVNLPDAEQKGNEVILSEEGEERARITVDILNELSTQDLKLIKALEKSMQERFRIWTEVYPLLAVEMDPIRKAHLDLKLKEITNDMCSDLNKIMKLMKAKGIDLMPHYKHITSICQDL